MRLKHAGDHSELGRLWREWSRAVAMIMRSSQGTRQRLSDEAYSRLHTSLLQSLQSQQIPRRERGRHRTLYGEMEELCHPWVSLESFRSADQRIVRDLLHRSRCVELRLTGDHRLTRDLCVAILIACGMSLGAVALVFHKNLESLLWGDSLVIELRSLGWQMLYALQQFTLLQYTAVLTLGVVAMGMWMMWTTKSY